MHIRHLKFITILCVTLLTILFSAVFHQPGVSAEQPRRALRRLLAAAIQHPYTPLPDIHNGDFEHGDNGDWTAYSSNDYYLITHDLLPIPPRSGNWLAWMGGVPEEDSRISQGLSLPSDGPVYLRYYYQVDSFGQDSCTQDWMFFLVGPTAAGISGAVRGFRYLGLGAGNGQPQCIRRSDDHRHLPGDDQCDRYGQRLLYRRCLANQEPLSSLRIDLK